VSLFEHTLSGAPIARAERPVAAGRFARVPDATWDVLLVAVAAYLLAAVGRVHQLFPALESLRPALITGAVAILIYLVDQRSERRLRRLWTAPSAWLVALLAWMMLSVPGALVRSTSVELVVDNFLKTVLMYFVIAGAVRGFRDVERLAVVYFAGAAIYAAVIILRFDVGSGELWRLGHLYYYDANDFATFAVTALPLGLYCVATARRLSTRGIAGAALAVLALAFVWTGSRGGFIAFIAVLIYVVVRYRAVPFVWRATATGLVAVVVLVAASERYWDQMGTILSDADYNRTSETGRMQIWSRGIGYVMSYPVFGVGPDNFPAAEGLLSPFASRQGLGVGVRWNAAHNSYLQVAAELGLPGLVCFVALLAASLAVLARAARRARRADPASRVPQLAQALTGSLIGFMVGAFFLSLAYAEMLYTLVAFAVALHKVTTHAHRPPHRV
jgi:O-antigen ligase